MTDALNNAAATLCVHAGEARPQNAGAPLATPIAQTSVFTMTVEEMKQFAAGAASPDTYMYTRYANPTTRAAEQKIAALEAAEDCVISASGQAAMTAAVLATCAAEDEIVAMADIYGGTLKLLATVFERFAISVTLLPFADLPHLERHLSSRTRLVILETPTNPLLRCVDIADLSAKAHAVGAKVLVDNTFATPILQQPLKLGADLSMHSATKYLGGHSDLSAGALAGSRELISSCRSMHIMAGGTLDPAASYLLIRGMKTLELRMERACANAQRLATVLSAHPRVARVFYPGLPAHPGHAVAARQMSAFGAMLSLELAGGGSQAERFLSRLKLWLLAASLGGVESNVSYPVLMSHAGMAPQQWQLLGITPGMVRLSTGIEAFDDLAADLEQALAD